jgi:hypothetical protein
MSTSDGPDERRSTAGGGWCSRLGYSWVPVSSGVRSARAGAERTDAPSPWTTIGEPVAGSDPDRTTVGATPASDAAPRDGLSAPPHGADSSRAPRSVPSDDRPGSPCWSSSESRCCGFWGPPSRICSSPCSSLVRDGARGQLHPCHMELAPRPRDGAAPRNRVPRHAPDRFCRGRSKSRSGDEPPDAAGIDIGEMSPREFIRSG